MSGLEIRSKKLKLCGRASVVHPTAKQVINWSFHVADQMKAAAIRLSFHFSQKE